jgi:hypothetical protein
MPIFSIEDSRVIIAVVQEGAVKIYVAAVDCGGANEKGKTE